jgi:transposase
MDMGKASVTFKEYNQDQMTMLPASLSELIAGNHPVRVVNEIINKINLQPLLEQYKGGGTSSYHPKMLLKILVYGYVSNIYSSRKLETAVKENIPFKWLAAGNSPDHHTINRFRGKRLQNSLRKIFTQVVELLAEEGLLSIKEIYVDGTKIESVANRYTFVWGNAIKTNKEKMGRQLEELWQYSQKVAEAELDEPEPPDFTVIDKEKVQQAVEKIDAALKDKPVSKEVKQKLGYIKKNWPAKLDQYAAQEQILNGRKSYSKTDNDATFMRMKEDHMNNGQLKPAYNAQVSTSNQFIVDYSIHQKPTDTTTLTAHLEQHREQYGELPECITADAGYGSEENLQYAEDNNMEGYVKYNYFDKQQQDSYNKKHPFAPGNLHYNNEKDCFYCPMGQVMDCIGSSINITTTGYEQHLRKYQAKNCEGCPLRGVCHKAKGNRIIEVNHNLNRLKQIAWERLNSEEGVAHRKQRCHDVEPAFGNIKSNHGFRRFLLKGKKKVAVEFGLLALAQNIRKKVTKMAKNAPKKSHLPTYAAQQTSTLKITMPLAA